MTLVDTHCHLDAHYFPEGADAVVARARTAGVHGFVVIGVGADLQPAREAIELARRVPASIAAVVGVHPHDAAGLDAARREELAALAADPAVVAVGETGLDYHYDHSPREAQREAFAWHIALARSIGKPLVIHTRSAPADTLDVLVAEGARDVGGIIHCFSEDWAFAQRALELGFWISFSGIVTFKNAKAIQEVASKVPADRYLVETDSPYLAPIPFRGKPCEPAYVVHIAARIAELRAESVERVHADTSRNAEQVFRRTFV